MATKKTTPVKATPVKVAAKTPVKAPAKTPAKAKFPEVPPVEGKWPHPKTVTAQLRKDLAVAHEEIVNLQTKLASANQNVEKAVELTNKQDNYNGTLQTRIAELIKEREDLREESKAMSKDLVKKYEDMLGENIKLREKSSLQEDQIAQKEAAVSSLLENEKFLKERLNEQGRDAQTWKKETLKAEEGRAYAEDQAQKLRANTEKLPALLRRLFGI